MQRICWSVNLHRVFREGKTFHVHRSAWNAFSILITIRTMNTCEQGTGAWHGLKCYGIWFNYLQIHLTFGSNRTGVLIPWHTPETISAHETFNIAALVLNFNDSPSQAIWVFHRVVGSFPFNTWFSVVHLKNKLHKLNFISIFVCRFLCLIRSGNVQDNTRIAVLP